MSENDPINVPERAERIEVNAKKDGVYVTVTFLDANDELIREVTLDAGPKSNRSKLRNGVLFTPLDASPGPRFNLGGTTAGSTDWENIFEREYDE